jgi:hypothetical protein
MAIAVETEGRGQLAIRITGAASAAAAGLGAQPNPEGKSVLILRTTLIVFTASTGAATITIGVAADASSSANDIINALAMNGVSANTCYNGHVMQNSAKTAITAPALWESGKYITLTGSASTVGLDAMLLVDYVRL